MDNLANKTMDCTDFGATIGDWMNQDRYRLEFQTQGDTDSYDISCDTHLLRNITFLSSKFADIS